MKITTKHTSNNPVTFVTRFALQCCSYSSGLARGGSGIPVYRKKFAKIPQNIQNSSKYTQNYTQVYFIHAIQRKWYTDYPYLSCNIPYTRLKKPLNTVYPKTLADPVYCYTSTLSQSLTLSTR